MTSCPSSYPFGSEIQFSVLFTNVKTGNPEDPTDVTLKIQHGSDAVETFTYSGGQVQRSGIGAYFYNFAPDAAGSWVYSWEGTGDVVGSTPNISFSVTPNLFGP